MSQTSESQNIAPQADCACTPESMAATLRQAKISRHQAGLRQGPAYNDSESAPLVFFDQVFARQISPAGHADCPTALRVGQSQNGLDVMLVASHKNTGPITIAAGATITLTLYQSDRPDSGFAEVGPTICVKAPAEGISACPDMLIARFALGNFKKPWLKVALDFTGDISGGTLDCALGYAAR